MNKLALVAGMAHISNLEDNLNKTIENFVNNNIKDVVKQVIKNENLEVNERNEYIISLVVEDEPLSTNEISYNSETGEIFLILNENDDRFRFGNLEVADQYFIMKQLLETLNIE